MHSATKAGTLGTALVILGVMLLGEVARPSTGFLTILFLLVTLPFGAQLLGRAAYLSGTPLADIDDDPLAAAIDADDTHR
jgi:multicomponent Na+:H+ antiporter subunit G